MSATQATPRKRLVIYMNDHLAGATLGVELARRALGNNPEGELGAMLRGLVSEIEEDRRTLLTIMGRLDAAASRLKQAAGWGAEKAGRLKLNGQLSGYSSLSRLVELEGLSIGVEGKLLLWQALELAVGGDPRLEGIDFDALIQRAKGQRDALEEQRRTAAAAALSVR